VNSQLDSFEDLQDRFLRLEKQNRRFKQLVVVVLAIATVIVVMGQAPAKKTVEANEFLLRDSNGKVRARLSMDGDVAQMVFLDAKGTKNLELTGAVAGLFGGSVVVSNERGDSVSALFADDDGGSFRVSGPSDGGKSSSILLRSGSLDITDADGFSTTVGVADLTIPKTGEKQKTSAASVVLFDKDNKVIWRAP
jgi:hypothetical protein